MADLFKIIKDCLLGDINTEDVLSIDDVSTDESEIVYEAGSESDSEDESVLAVNPRSWIGH
jgi:hypothetical protein